MSRILRGYISGVHVDNSAKFPLSQGGVLSLRNSAGIVCRTSVSSMQMEQTTSASQEGVSACELSPWGDRDSETSEKAPGDLGENA